MTTDIPHIPAEIHRLIAQYVHREDLPSYRLVNRQLCDIGTEELFRTIVFHYSTASIERLNELSASERLRGCAKTIFWDINLWSIPRLRDFHEWKLYFPQAATYRLRDSGIASKELESRFTRLSQNHAEWEAYVDKVKDEKKAKKALERLQALGRFQNLQSVHIVNGELLPAHRGLRKVADHLPYALPEPCLFRRGEGTNDYDSMPGVEAYQPIQQNCNSTLKKLKLDRVHPNVFPLSTLGDFDNLTSLDIKMTAWSNHYRYPTEQSKVLVMNGLRDHLTRLPQLECLRVELNSKEVSREFADRAVSSIHHIFGSEHTWLKLRKLSLRHFFATPDTLVSLLDRHSSTLKDLRLHDILWEEDGKSKPEPLLLTSIRYCAWPQVLQKMSECSSLERATVSGTLGERGRVIGWRLAGNDELAAAISDYLINGGQCPLTAGDAEFDSTYEGEDS